MKYRFYTYLLYAFVLPGFFSGCDRLPQQTNQRRDIILTKTEQALSAEANRFAFDLFQQVNTEDKNYFISPLSTSLALSMTANGTAGETAAQMKDVLGFEEFTYEQMNGFFKKMSAELKKADQLTELGIANSVWILEGFPVYEKFKDIVRTWYLAQIEELDFFSPTAIQTINDWCAAKTNGKIDEIIDEIPPSMVMYLINALYFKGTWTYSFDKAASYSDRFYGDDGSSPLTDFMLQTETFPYLDHELCQVAELPYGNEAFSMVLMLPKPGVHVDRMIKEFMNTQKWDIIARELKDSERKLTVSMPKFRFEYEKDLIPTLQAMGMIIPFMEGMADFSNMSPSGGLYIGLVKQKTYVEVNEEGTEAAAVTVVGVEKSAIEPDDPLPFYVNRSFVYVIKEKSTGIILFMGKMSDLNRDPA
ncbi:MAG: serpin family protein [Bacteroidales bacterium]|jgi:serpin B